MQSTEQPPRKPCMQQVPQDIVSDSCRVYPPLDFALLGNGMLQRSQVLRSKRDHRLSLVNEKPGAADRVEESCCT